MEKFERVSMSKVRMVRYVYDFSAYSVPDSEIVKQIREKFKSKLLLIMCSRLIVFKRHILVFETLSALLKEKALDIKMIVLDEGPEESKLRLFIATNRLEESIHMVGYRRDFINYMAASDLMIHPSLTEASNSAVKEYALLEKTVAVCNEVGDFSEYILDEQNGFLMSISNTNEDIKRIILEAYNHPEKLSAMGKQLKRGVVDKYAVSDDNFREYDQLLRWE